MENIVMQWNHIRWYSLGNLRRPWQIGLGRLVSTKRWWFWGSPLVYQRVQACLDMGYTPQKYFASGDPHHGIQLNPSDILSGKSSGILSGILSGISSDILSGISSGILSGILCGILSGISSDILSGIASSILYVIPSDILSGISSDILFGKSSDILSSLWHPIWRCFWPLRSGWGPAGPKVRRISPDEVRWGPQRSDSRRLRSGEAHCNRELAVEVRRVKELADEVRRGPLRSRAGGGPARRRTRRRRKEGRKGGREEGRKGGREEGRKGGREEGRKGGAGQLT